MVRCFLGFLGRQQLMQVKVGYLAVGQNRFAQGHASQKRTKCREINF